MLRRAKLYAVVLLTFSMLLAPLARAAGSGGVALAPSPGSSATVGGSSSSSGTSTPSTTAAPVGGSVQASGNGITVAARPVVLLRSALRFSGSVAGHRGWIVEIERRGRQTGGAWVPTTHGTVHGNGSFSAVWPTNHIGQFAIRAVLERLPAGASRGTPASPAVTITVYRPAIATIYGPGFFGSQTACGQTLRRNTLGVANRTLPCGTRVSLLWHGRTIVVPVIDRGPYANGADWDLTSATATALGMNGTETIGAVSLPR